jgi:hypothetical protein
VQFEPLRRARFAKRKRDDARSALMAIYYGEIKWLHICCVLLSGNPEASEMGFAWGVLHRFQSRDRAPARSE